MTLVIVLTTTAAGFVVYTTHKMLNAALKKAQDAVVTVDARPSRR